MCAYETAAKICIQIRSLVVDRTNLSVPCLWANMVLTFQPKCQTNCLHARGIAFVVIELRNYHMATTTNSFLWEKERKIPCILNCSPSVELIHILNRHMLRFAMNIMKIPINLNSTIPSESTVFPCHVSLLIHINRLFIRLFLNERRLKESWVCIQTDEIITVTLSNACFQFYCYDGAIFTIQRYKQKELQ